jgi:RNA polymerase sigma factor (sigma-70 family)
MARIDLETLLGEAAWLARVARGVAGGEADAADAVQDAWVAALRSPPDDDRPARPWLRRVVQNAVRMRRRGETRRAVHEEAFEGAREAAPTPEELLERAQLERRLAEAVIALDEPYRSTVMLRYREGLTAERIAEIQDVPAGTVRWRLKTALDRLRADLADARETRAWRAMVAPAAVASARRVALLGGIVMSTKTKIALVIAALLLLGGAVLLVVWRGGAHEEQAKVSPARGVVRRLATPGGPGSDPARVAVALVADPSMPARRIAGRVLDGDAPAAGATVQLVLAGVPVLVAEVTADRQGAFDLGEHAAAAYRVIASAPDRAPDQAAIDLRRSAPVDALVLALTGCDHVVTGTVQDGEGTPIAHARIAPELDDWPAVETTADGRYRVCLPYGQASLLYRADGYSGALVDVGSDGPVTRDVVLIPEVVVSGTVVRPDGEPVGGAWVSLEPNPFGAERSAPVHVLTGPDGRFAASGVASGRNLISARADGWATPRAVEIVATAGEPIVDLVVVVEPNVRLTGVVVDRAGAPVAGAGLQLRIANKIEGGTIAITGPDGRFAIASVPPVDLGLVVEGHTVVAPRILRGDGGDVTVEVTRLATVRGRVLRAGRPVAGAMVECVGLPRTGADGRYACLDLLPGHVELGAQDATRWGLVSLDLAPGETREVDIELTYSAMICGEVVDGTGAPVPNASARFVQPSGDEGTGVTDAAGHFCARRLSGGGDYAATVTIGGVDVPAATPFPVVNVEGANQRVDGIRLAIVHERGAIAGRVVDSSGAPVADARVVAEPASAPPSVLARYHVALSATTGADGRFRIDGLTRGAYALLARGGDGGLTTAHAETGADDVQLTLDPAGRIDGRLVGFRSPPRVVAIAEGGVLPPLDAQLDGDAFHITAVPPGRYFLTAVTGPESDTAVVEVAPGAPATTTMASRGTGVIVGRVVDHATGAPVSGCLCDTSSRDGAILGVQYYSTDSRTLCDAGGRFRIDPAPAGEIAVICDGARTSRGFRAVELPRDGVLDVEVPVVALTGGAGDPGMYVEPVEHRVRDRVPGGPADRAGIAIDDVITHVDQTDVSRLSPQGIRALILQRPARSAATLTLRRGAHTLTVTLTPAP